MSSKNQGVLDMEKLKRLSEARDIDIRYQTSPADLLQIAYHRKHWDDIPVPYFYRVFYNESGTIYDEELGFVSGAFFSMPRGFADAFVNHLFWNRKKSVPSPFISVFSNEDQARRWAAQREERQSVSISHTNIRIAKIDTKELAESKGSFGIFKSMDLFESLSPQMKERVDKNWKSEHEYLCLWHIPKSAIKKILPLDSGQSFSKTDLRLLFDKMHLGKFPDPPRRAMTVDRSSEREQQGFTKEIQSVELESESSQDEAL